MAAPDHEASLPLIKRAPRSTRGKWRAWVLLLVHVAIAAHITHYIVQGETLSPVEPSESMYALELGYVNAGFIFFAVALLATFLFGRFFCGWGCHVVALQDASAWLLKRIGIRPQPFRSRLLLWVPLLLALYMFVWPTVKRLWIVPTPFAGWSNHLMTDRFWETFPGPLFAILTFLVCGAAAVYFLGAKGFCTYGCPYGGFFGVVDQLSPGTILVDDDLCEGCGHCTAVCTSNVIVHDEVKRFGKVVDPGCMKCMDCVSACPKKALRFGWSTPSLFKKDRLKKKGRPRRFDLSWSEEGIAALTFAISLVAFRGLYDGPPLLMAVGLAGVSSFLAVRWVRLFSRPHVRLKPWTLKSDGRWRLAGVTFAVLTLGWFGFALHSAVAQGSRLAGRHYLSQTEATRADVLSGRFRDRWYGEDHSAAATKSLRHFQRAERWSLVDVPEVKLGLAWGLLLQNEVDPAAALIEEAVRLNPSNPQLREDLFQLFMTRGKLDDAIRIKREQFATGHSSVPERMQFALMLAQAGRSDDAIQEYEAILASGVDQIELRYNLGGLLRRAGQLERAIVQFEAAAELAPYDPDVQVEWGLSLQALGRHAEAITRLETAIRIAPQRVESTSHLPNLILESERALAAESR